MVSIRQRLLRAEDNFLSAVAEGSLDSFSDEQWTPLLHDLESAIQSSSVDDDTIALAYATASRVALLAEISHEMYVYGENLTYDVMNEVEEMLSQLTIADFPPRSRLSIESVVKNAITPFDDQGPRVQRGIADVYGDTRLSPTPSLVSLSTVDESDEDVFSAPVIGRKRDAGSLEDSNVSSGRIAKRPRPSYTPAIKIGDEPVISEYSNELFLSPLSPSPVQFHVPLLDVNQALKQNGDAPHLGPPSRKRRLSDADISVAVKRPRGLPAGPRLHAVSDPFPIGSRPVLAPDLDDWFEVHFGTSAAPSLSWEEIERSATVQVDFFDAWASMNAVDNGFPVHQTADSTEYVTRHVNTNPDLQPMVSSKTVDARSSTEFVDGLSSMALSSKNGGASTNSFSTASKNGIIPEIISPTVPEVSPPLYQCSSISDAQSTHSDVISLYTTLYDTEPIPTPASCSDIYRPVIDISVQPPTLSKSASDEEDWSRFLAALDQPLEIVLPSPPPPYDISTDATRLLESLLQPVEVSDVPSHDTQIPSDKQKKLKELEAAKEAVRRLEAEVWVTA